MQVIGWSRKSRARQRLQAMQGMMSSCRSSAILLGRSGSAIIGRHISQKSIVPFAIAASGNSGTKSRYAMHVGTSGSAFLTSSATLSHDPIGQSRVMTLTADSCQPAVMESRSTPASIAILISWRDSSGGFPPRSLRSSSPQRRMTSG